MKITLSAGTHDYMLHIISFLQWGPCSAAAVEADGFILHKLLPSVSRLPVCHFKSDAFAKYKNTSNCHQSLERNSQKTSLPLFSSKLQPEPHVLLSFSSHALPASRLSLDPCQTNVALSLIPVLSQWNSWFQLSPLLGLYVHIHTHLHTHIHTLKCGAVCFLWLTAMLKK